jgi:DNA-binding response OmpR family regulator
MRGSVLVADPSPTIRRVVELSCAGTGLRVVTAATAGEAFAQLAAAPPDVLLADLELPGLDGYALCRRVKCLPDPPSVLLLAGILDGFDPRRAEGCGADGQLTKPFDSAVLLARVRELLRAAEARRRVPAPRAAPDARPRSMTEPQIESIARSVAERLVGPLATELARELGRA